MKVLLLDDHPLVRSALEAVIQSLGQDVRVFSAASAAQARQMLAEHGPVDLVLLDLNLPDVNGFALMADWRRTDADMRVVVISASEHPADVVRALEEGAMGFIPKRTSNEVLLHALKMVMSGGIYVPPMALRVGQGGTERSLLSVAGESHGPDLSVPQVHEAQPAARMGYPVAAGRIRAGLTELPALRLTPRQSEVLELLLQGQPNKLIARQLNLSVETVKDHVASLLRVLGVSSRTQAVLAVSQMAGGSVGGLNMGRAAPLVGARPAA